MAAALAVLLLGACSTTEQRVLKPEELTSIKHVCIIQNAKVRPHDLDRALSKALAKRGIGSTIVTADNRGKLYDSSCPYNLRYKTKGNNEILRKGVFVLRSTKYAVSTVSYSLNDENHFRTNPDLVKQAEGVVAKLLEKKQQIKARIKKPACRDREYRASRFYFQTALNGFDFFPKGFDRTLIVGFGSAINCF